MSNIAIVAAREELLSIDYIWALAQAIKRLGLSRRRVLDWLAEVIYGWLEAGGTIVDADGRQIRIDDDMIDRVHGYDGSCSWPGVLKQAADVPPRRRPKATLWRRLQLYDAAFGICGRPVSKAARKRELAETRALVRGFSPTQRARYIHIVRDLRRRFANDPAGHRYSRAIKALRLRLAAEGERWQNAR